MHHDHAPITRGRAAKGGRRMGELGLPQPALHRQVSRVQRQRVPVDAGSRVESDERHARHVELGLEVGADVSAILLVNAPPLPEAERRKPPRDVVVPRHDDERRRWSSRVNGPPNVAQENGGPLKLAGARALSDVAGDRDDVEWLLSPV
jgi:hypothetical protein